MPSLMDRVRHFLDSDDWEYEREGDDQVFMQFGGDHGQWPVMAHVQQDAGQVLFYSLAPLTFPPALLPAVAEFVVRANYGLHIGSFDLDLEDGSVQFRTSVDVEQDEDALTPTVLKHLLYHNVITMDRYLPGLQALLEEGVTPTAAIAAVEAE